jgi:hypothetical protein
MSRNNALSIFIVTLFVALVVALANLYLADVATAQIPNANELEQDRAEQEDGDEPLSMIEVPLLNIDRPEERIDLPEGLYAQLRVLDKVTARTNTVNIYLDRPLTVGRLEITMRYCKSSPPEDPPETNVFLEIDEDKEGIVERIFTGWMFASSPGIHALEHPVFDVWPIICKTSSGEIFTAKE